MRYALSVEARTDIAPVARAVEAAGFDHLWVYDSPLVYSDATVACVLALQATERIVVGPGVANPRQRIAPHTAQMAATLSKLAPGRVAVGLGAGASARRSLGMSPAPRAELLDHARVTREMLAGRAVEYREGERRALVRFVHPEGRWIDLSVPVPVWVSAFGARALAAAGAVADGVLIRWEGAERARAARRAITAAARSVGRDPSAVALGAQAVVYPVGGDADTTAGRAAVRDALGPIVVGRIVRHVAAGTPAEELPEGLWAALSAYVAQSERLDPADRHCTQYTGYLVDVPACLEELLTPDAIGSVACVGTAAQVARELETMAEAGVDHVSLQIAGDIGAYCALMAERVLPLLSGGTTHGGGGNA